MRDLNYKKLYDDLADRVCDLELREERISSLESMLDETEAAIDSVLSPSQHGIGHYVELKCESCRNKLKGSLARCREWKEKNK